MLLKNGQELETSDSIDLLLDELRIADQFLMLLWNTNCTGMVLIERDSLLKSLLCPFFDNLFKLDKELVPTF